MQPTESTPLAASKRKPLVHSESMRIRTHSFWLSADDDSFWAGKIHGAASVQASFVQFLNLSSVQIILVLLLVVDVIVVVVELFLDAEYPPCFIIQRDAISCIPEDAVSPTFPRESAFAAAPHSHRALADPALAARLAIDAVAALANDASWNPNPNPNAHHHNLCGPGLVEAPLFPATCDPHKWGTVHTLHEVLFCISISILGIFAVELLLLFAILGTHFLRTPLYLLDLGIVGLSLGLEIGLKGRATSELAGIIALARAWRFVRIGHGLATAMHEMPHDAAHGHDGAHHDVREDRLPPSGDDVKVAVSHAAPPLSPSPLSPSRDDGLYAVPPDDETAAPAHPGIPHQKEEPEEAPFSDDRERATTVSP